MKILFLDVDGVLNNEGVFRDKRFGPIPLDHKAISRLHDLIRKTDCRIVLSSSWRDMPDLERKLEADFVFEVFVELGQDRLQVRHEDGSTQRLGGYRGREIEEWLSRHPEVTHYAIVDDDSDMLPEQLPFFVQTDFRRGLTDSHLKQLTRILNQCEASSTSSSHSGLASGEPPLSVGQSSTGSPQESQST